MHAALKSLKARKRACNAADKENLLPTSPTSIMVTKMRLDLSALRGKQTSSRASVESEDIAQAFLTSMRSSFGEGRAEAQPLHELVRSLTLALDGENPAPRKERSTYKSPSPGPAASSTATSSASPSLRVALWEKTLAETARSKQAAVHSLKRRLANWIQKRVRATPHSDSGASTTTVNLEGAVVLLDELGLTLGRTVQLSPTELLHFLPALPKTVHPVAVERQWREVAGFVYAWAGYTKATAKFVGPDVLQLQICTRVVGTGMPDGPLGGGAFDLYLSARTSEELQAWRSRQEREHIDSIYDQMLVEWQSRGVLVRRARRF